LAPSENPLPLRPAFASAQQPVKVVLCKTDLTKILVFREDDTIMHEVRSIQLSADLGQQPWVTCKLHHGFYSPTAAETKKWPVTSMELVTDEEFQELIDAQYAKDMKPSQLIQPAQVEQPKPMPVLMPEINIVGSGG